MATFDKGAGGDLLALGRFAGEAGSGDYEEALRVLASRYLPGQASAFIDSLLKAG